MNADLPDFRRVWLVDTEFRPFNGVPGARSEVVCVVAREYKSGRTVRIWQDDLRSCPSPVPASPDVLLVAYYASAELQSFMELGWSLPEHILDLYTEFRWLTNGRQTPNGRGLVGALLAFGFNAIPEKKAMRKLVLRGGPWNHNERRAILDYCTEDVQALEQLLPVMAPMLDLPRALLRGRHMVSDAHMVRQGVPVDVDLYQLLKEKWSTIRERLVAKIDRDYGLFEGTTFKYDRFVQWLIAHNIGWPLKEDNKRRDERLDMRDDTFREMARAHPVIAPIRELRSSLAQLRLKPESEDDDKVLTVGCDGRARTMLSPFGASSGRSTPSSTGFIFGQSVWLRGLIKPPPGRALIYADWSQQEFGVAAALSKDPNMLAAYLSGDPYLAFGKLAGAIPAWGTKETHPAERDAHKTVAIAVQYGMQAESLARRLNQLPIVARHLLCDHQEAYPVFWRWSDSAAITFSLHSELQTMFGWRLLNGSDRSERTARNFPIQAAGAEMMRLACYLMVDAGITVCCTVHDAFLVECDLADVEDVARAVQAHMAAASLLVHPNLELRSDIKVIGYPDRYRDPRGAKMWATVMELLGRSPTGTRRRQKKGRYGMGVKGVASEWG
jgi:hypothetical protein